MPDIKKYWKSFLTKLLLRLQQLKGTPYSVAAGFACGVAISFTPFIGFHLVLAAITAWIIRANIVSSAIGTLIGNPWTFPFIWIAVLSTGRFLMGNFDPETNINFLKIFTAAGRALLTFNFKHFGRDVWPIFFPMLIGCIPFYIASWFLSFKLIHTMLEKINRRRQKRLAAKGEKDDTRTGM